MSLVQATYNPLSPKQIDYMLKGYFGGMATLATGAVDGMARPFQDKGERPSLTTRDYTAGFVRDIPQNQSKYVNDFYQEREKVEQAFQSMSEARQRGDIGKAQEIFQDHQEEISSRPAYSEVEKDVASINRMLRQVEASTSMSGDAKRTMIDQLNQQRDQVTERLHEALLSRR